MSYALAMFLHSIASTVEKEISGVYKSNSYPLEPNKEYPQVNEEKDAIGVLKFEIKNNNETLQNLKHCLEEMVLDIEKTSDCIYVTAYIVDFDETKNSNHTLQLSFDKFS
jgi:enamine deaminase RidA (YjgF/YER057c/UK114 family)